MCNQNNTYCYMTLIYYTEKKNRHLQLLTIYTRMALSLTDTITLFSPTDIQKYIHILYGFTSALVKSQR